MFLGCYCVLGGGWLGKGGGGGWFACCICVAVFHICLIPCFFFFLLLFSLKNKMFMFLTMWPRSSLAGWICHDNFTRKKKKNVQGFHFCSAAGWLGCSCCFLFCFLFLCVWFFFFLIFLLLFFFFFWVLNCFCFLLLFLSVLCLKSVMHLTLADTKL